MKRLVSGVAVTAALAFSAPVWAQAPSPSGGNAMGMPGPNAGGPGLTPYSGGGAPPPAAPTGRGFGPKASGGNYIAPSAAATAPPAGAAAMPPPSSAMPPPAHHAKRHAKATRGHRKHMAGGRGLTGDTTAALNRQELARIQSGNLSNPAAPAGPPPSR